MKNSDNWKLRMENASEHAKTSPAISTA